MIVHTALEAARAMLHALGKAPATAEEVLIRLVAEGGAQPGT
jgi:hypothetical protein